MNKMQAFDPQFKIVASSEKEAAEIGNFFINLMNYMPREKLLGAARKVNKDPSKKVNKMNKHISHL